MAKMLVCPHRHHELERLLADVLAINCAVEKKQAERYLLQAIATAEQIESEAGQETWAK